MVGNPQVIQKRFIGRAFSRTGEIVRGALRAFDKAVRMEPPAIAADAVRYISVTLVINPAVPQLSPQDKQSGHSVLYRDSLFA
jgi:hypothetical protein